MTSIYSNTTGIPGRHETDRHPESAGAAGKRDDAVSTPTLTHRVTQGLSSITTPLTIFGSGDTSNPLTNGNGAPTIPVPPSRLDPATAMNKLQRLIIESESGSLSAQKSQANQNIRKQENVNKLNLESLKKAQEKQSELAHKSVLGKIFSWIGKVVGVVAATVAVAVTGVAAAASGGLAIPLLALSVAGLVGATMSLANQASQELGGPEISLSNLVSGVTTRLLEAMHVGKDTAEKIGKLMVGAAAVLLPPLVLVDPGMLGTAAEGLCLAVGASPETAATVASVISVAGAITVGIGMAVATALMTGGLSVLSDALRLANNIVQAASTVVKGSTMVASGAIAIDGAVQQQDLTRMQAYQKKLEAVTKTLQQTMKDQQETLGTLLDQIQSSLKQVSAFIQDLFKSLSLISNNIARTQSA